MKHLNALYFLLILLTISCSAPKQEEAVASESPQEQAVEEVPEITGFDTIEEIAASVVASLKTKDYASYYSHVMNEELELSQAALIQDSTIRKEFLHEYGFSLHEEKEYFDNLLKYYEDNSIDLDKVVLEDLEYTEYKGGEYHPLELYEVFVPIEMEYESLIDFTIIKVDGKFYLTSELGV